MTDRDKNKWRKKIDGFSQEKIDSYRWSLTFSRKYSTQDKIFIGHLMDQRQDQLYAVVEVIK